MIQVFRFPARFLPGRRGRRQAVPDVPLDSVVRKLGPVADAMTTEKRRRRSNDIGALEEDANNLNEALDTNSMYPHNRQFSTEGCPSG